jgi:quinol monooxygenase YgiN
MSVMVILEMQSNTGNTEQIKATLKDLLPDTRKYDGCQSVEVFDNQDDPNNLVLVQHWNSRQQYETYLNWRTETGALGTFVSMTSQDPTIRYFDIADV